MAKRPASKRKTKKKWKIRRPKIKRWHAISILLVLILFSAGILLYLQKEKKSPSTTIVTKKEEPLLPHVEPPKKESPSKVPPAEKPFPSGERTKIRGKGASAKIAIVIDDLGNNRDAFNKFVKLEIPFSFSVLPHQDNSIYISKEVRKRKYDLLLHLPMEPEDNEKVKGEGFIVSEMTPNEMLKQLEHDLKSVPGAIGVNNHMGSFLTQDRKAMAIILGEIKRNGLFFVDSRTTSKTVAYDVAKKLGLKSAERNIFLDDIEDEEEVIKQIELLINTAKKNGVAIGIGHPRPETIAALEKMLPALKSNGIEVVPVSRLVN
ncbi:MAG: divergent polysaccharide deacetylase family protein [Nitrospirae bacterium]|nr:divergent polysaccharide deacetylase family protein [Nitrospirota bacterium]